jgi:hypothetical protein
MSKKRGTNKPEIVRVGNTPVRRITPEERKKLHKLMKKSLPIVLPFNASKGRVRTADVDA